MGFALGCWWLAMGWAVLVHPAAAAVPATPPLTVDPAARRVVVPATVLKQGSYLELKGAIEYVLVAKGGKEYEAVFVTSHLAKDIHAALSKLGLRGGQPAADGKPPKGQPVNLFVEYEVKGKTTRRPVDELIVNMKTGQPLQPIAWTFTGSSQTVDPSTGQPILQASLTQSIIGLHPSDPSALLQNPRPESVSENIYRANVKELPPEATPVRLIFERIQPTIPAGTRRIHVFVRGRVQGVGFRAFTQHQAGLLKVLGFVKNLPDGRVEAMLEGPTAQVEKLLEKLKQGPHAAKVEGIEVKEESPEGDFAEFEIQY